MRPRIKICCIQSRAEAAIAVDAGADCIGLVGRGLSGPEVIDDDELIAHIAASVPPGVTPWLLTRETDPSALAAQVVRTQVGTVQICDAVSPAAWGAVRRAAPAVRIVQVVHVQGSGAVDEAQRVAAHVDAVLLDSGVPAGDAPVYGGTGRTHDWGLSARIVEVLDTPVWLAGGLRPSNVREALATVAPFGVDLCSGVRTDGALDARKARAFVAAALA